MSRASSRPLMAPYYSFCIRFIYYDCQSPIEMQVCEARRTLGTMPIDGKISRKVTGFGCAQDTCLLLISSMSIPVSRCLSLSSLALILLCTRVLARRQLGPEPLGFRGSVSRACHSIAHMGIFCGVCTIVNHIPNLRWEATASHSNRSHSI